MSVIIIFLKSKLVSVYVHTGNEIGKGHAWLLVVGVLHFLFGVQ